MAKLWLIPTPIGNLEDVTLRALRMLQEADVILAEDTRQTTRLLSRHNISAKLMPHHAYNEHKSVNRLVQKIREGSNIALVTDGGTPAISDPGFLIVRECIRAGLTVECLPGPTAFVPALVVSGLPSNSFCFEGFLPHKKGRRKKLHELSSEKRTMIFYESPHRFMKLLRDFAETFGENRKISVSRELTKIYEETRRGSIRELIGLFSERTIKGEIVIVVEGNPEKKKNRANSYFEPPEYICPAQ